MTATVELGPQPIKPGLAGQVGRFATIGAVSTLAYVGLYSVVRSFEPAPLANAVALITTTIGNTAANRRLTFGVRGRVELVRDHLVGLAGLVVALAVTTVSLGLLDHAVARPSRTVELVVLIGANAFATICRFVLLRTLIARGGAPASSAINLERTPS